MLKALVGSRLPSKYQKYFDLPERLPSFRQEAASNTTLSRACGQYLSNKDGKNAVYRLDLGHEALGMRLGLIGLSRKTIDIQSYLIRDDISGNLIASALLDAAERGVRVRLLLDDALTEEVDSGLLALNAHKQIEIRVFNPFPRRRSRLISFIANFNILNRRMHNKSFTVDNLVTIVGGRNIADEYYHTGGENEFVDEDLLAIGPVVDQVSQVFDTYWNTREAIPVSVFEPGMTVPKIEESQAEGRKYLAQHANHPLLQQPGQEACERLLDGELPFTIADVELVSDHPDKVRRIVRRTGSRTMDFLQKMVSASNEELVIVSPYFVPQRQGVNFLSSLVKKGVRVVIVTNSLASTNHSSVHAAYARYRRPLLRQGIELYELTPGRRRHNRRSDFDMATKLTLHSKVAVTDRQRVFVGSFNLDPRSLYLNTEMGMVVNSAEFSGHMAISILDLLPAFTYRLRLQSNGRLRWTYRDKGRRQFFQKEPDTSFLRRLLIRLMAYLPIEGQM